MKQRSDSEIIAEIEAERAAGTDLDGLVPLKVRTSKNLTMVYAIRFSPDEFTLFNDAAKAHGMTLADFLRSAARGAMAGDIDVERAAATAEVQEKARELLEATSRL